MKLFKRPLLAYVIVTVFYFALVILLPANHRALAAYNISPLQYHTILFLAVVPYIGIWFAAFYGFGKLREYAKIISRSAEGEDFHTLANGIKWLAYGLPATAIISIILNTIADHYHRFHSTAIISNNYINILIPLIAFTYLSRGSRNLTERVKIRLDFSGAKLIMAALAILGVLYCYFTFRHFDLQSVGSTNNPYFIPIWLMLLTVAIPYLYSWFIGLLAAYEILLYSRQVQGVIYRQALQFLGLGTVAVIVSLISLQYTSSIVPRTGFISLNSILILNYLIRIIEAIGFWLLAVGAKKLKKIEEV
ncbi:MAG: hypothetical protein JWN38_235 [Candidatus Saccharibacteria bacterium]|nr:hypothetical protein [Candidatus Saccharibacteria bacterium]